MSKKIVFYGGGLNRSGGTERVSSLIANGLVERGFRLIYINESGGDQPFFPIHPEIKIETLFKVRGRNLIRTPLRIYKLRKIINREKPDVFVSIDSMLVLFSVPALIGFSVAHICWEHFNFNVDFGLKSRRFARYLAANFCKDIVTLTEGDVTSWEKGLSLRSNVRAIPNPSPFPTQPPPDFSVDIRTVLCVGRLVHVKGFDLLLLAWRKVIDREKTWKLRIVGDGPEELNLKEIASNLGLEKHVEFVGAVKNVIPYYESAGIYCLSSRNEGFPLVLLEAMSFGLPIVSFDCHTGPAEILKFTNAPLVLNGDTDALAEGLLLLMRDSKLREEISRAEQKRVEDYQVEEIVSIWEDFLGESSTSLSSLV